jgi:F-type H+-transporting ATPase subunit b
VLWQRRDEFASAAGKGNSTMDPELIQTLVPIALTQLVAFLLFLWLLAKFAVGPVLALLDERRDKISAEFDKIASAEKRIAALKEEYEERLQGIDEEARKRMLDEVAKGRKVAEEIAEAARAESADITDKARRKLQLEVDQARIQLKDEIVTLTLGATERLLREQLDEGKHREMVGSFIEELERKN